MSRRKLTASAKKKRKIISLFICSFLFFGLAAVVGILGVNYIGNQQFKETFYCISSLKANNKIRVIQISDLHNATFGDDNSKLIDRVQKLEPDVIIYTGDCLDSHAESDEVVIELCAALAEIAPSFYIYGNNEVERFYDIPLTQEALDEKFGFDDETRDPGELLAYTDSLTEKLEEVGVQVLKNSSATITIGNTPVDIYGVLTSNPSSFWSYAGESFDEHIYTNQTHLKITAIHEPTVFETYAPDSWGDLMLAGHTHGGTVQVPMIGPLYTHDGGFLPAMKGYYVHGRFEVQGRPLIVSSGLENRNPLRFNNQPELVIIDINKF